MIKVDDEITPSTRTRGDKPARDVSDGTDDNLPAHAGINRQWIVSNMMDEYLPRTRGDKPWTTWPQKRGTSS
ncbi:hypothetical protein, partial [Bifidobacterium longum]|uniref:hypothetical protein n=1 Tax=Bifidobacterium longum TaxID=216816 RepID=UPI003990D170